MQCVACIQSSMWQLLAQASFRIRMQQQIMPQSMQASGKAFSTSCEAREHAMISCVKQQMRKCMLLRPLAGMFLKPNQARGALIINSVT